MCIVLSCTGAHNRFRSRIRCCFIPCRSSREKCQPKDVLEMYMREQILCVISAALGEEYAALLHSEKIVFKPAGCKWSCSILADLVFTLVLTFVVIVVATFNSLTCRAEPWFLIRNRAVRNSVHHVRARLVFSPRKYTRYYGRLCTQSYVYLAISAPTLSPEYNHVTVFYNYRCPWRQVKHLRGRLQEIDLASEYTCILQLAHANSHSCCLFLAHDCGLHAKLVELKEVMLGFTNVRQNRDEVTYDFHATQQW